MSRARPVADVVARRQARVGGLKPVAEVLFAAAALRTGEQVLDVGCGTGTTVTAARPGGRLVMTVWARRDDSDLFAVPLRAALDVLRRNGIPAPPPADDDGPFSLHDPAVVTALLTGAGWTEVTCTPHRTPLPIAGTDPAAAAHSILDSGPIRHVTAGLDDAARATVAAAVTDAFADHVDTDGQVRPDGRSWWSQRPVADRTPAVRTRLSETGPGDFRRAHPLARPYAQPTFLRANSKGADMIILGVILLVLGLILNVQILYILGAILAVVGVVFMVMGRSGRAVGGRKHYF